MRNVYPPSSINLLFFTNAPTRDALSYGTKNLLIDCLVIDFLKCWNTVLYSWKIDNFKQTQRNAVHDEIAAGKNRLENSMHKIN